jgi:transposase-like protein
VVRRFTKAIIERALGGELTHHLGYARGGDKPEVTAWQARPFEPRYPVVFFDARRVKIRDEAVVRSKAVYLAVAVLPDGSRDVLGIWIEQTEGATLWMKVFTDLKRAGVRTSSSRSPTVSRA